MSCVVVDKMVSLHRCSQRKGLGIGKGVVGSFGGGFQRLEIGEVSSHMVFHFKLAKKWWLMTCFPNVQLFCFWLKSSAIYSKGRVGPRPFSFLSDPTQTHQRSRDPVIAKEWPLVALFFIIVFQFSIGIWPKWNKISQTPRFLWKKGDFPDLLPFQRLSL